MKHGFFDSDAYRDSVIHHLDARSKILAFIGGVLVCVSTPPTAYSAFAVYAGVLAVVFFLSKLPLMNLCKRVLIVVPFAVMVAAFAPFLKPSQIAGGYSLGIGSAAIATPGLVVWNVIAKSLLAASMIILLTSSTTFPSLLQGLQRLRVPEIIIMLLSFTYRYIFVLTDEFQRLLRARDLRGYRGKWLGHASSLGHLIASMFIRTYERAERVYTAMISRGFEGRFSHLPAFPLSWRDGAFIAICLGSFLAARVALA